MPPRTWGLTRATGLPPTAIEETMHLYAQRLEHYCRQAPYNWFNFYDFWSGASH